MVELGAKLFICGKEERDEYRSCGISHLITVRNPGVENTPPDWFDGDHLPLSFGDVISQSDATACNTQPPRTDDVRKAILFFRRAWQTNAPAILVSCDYGASRSPALAYVCLADRLGTGKEQEALEQIINIRPEAIPNNMVVFIGDRLLRRDGALFQPLNDLHGLLATEFMESLSGD